MTAVRRHVHYPLSQGGPTRPRHITLTTSSDSHILPRLSVSQYRSKQNREDGEVMKLVTSRGVGAA